MSTNQETLKIRLPKGWKKQIRSAVLHVISLAQFATAHTRGWAANSINIRAKDHRQMQQPYLAHGFDRGAHCSRLLGTVASQLADAIFPVLLVGGCGCRSLQPPHYGNQRVCESPDPAPVLCIPRTNRQPNREAEVHYLRSRRHIRLQRVSTLGEA